MQWTLNSVTIIYERLLWMQWTLNSVIMIYERLLWMQWTLNSEEVVYALADLSRPVALFNIVTV